MKNAFAFLLLLLFGSPILLLILQAGAPGWRYPDLFPPISLHGVLFLSQQGAPIARTLLSSLGYSLATVGVTILMCLMPAQIFGQTTFRGQALLEGLLLTPALVPAMTFSMGLHIVFIKIGLADTYAGVVLVLAMTSYPYMLRALTTGYALMGAEYRLCSRNLGASAWTTFWQVELPLLLPALGAGASVVFLVAFSEYFMVFLIGGGNVESFTGYLFPSITSSNRGLGAAITLIFLLVPMSLFALLELGIKVYHRSRRMK